MPKIVAITNGMDDSLATGLEALGDVHIVPGNRFARCHEEMRQDRDADLLITNLPPGRTSFEGYTPSIHTVHETVLDLKIPVIVHTGVDSRQLWLFGSLPALVYLKEFKGSDQKVLAAATAIAKFWFPMSPTERAEFMDETLRLYLTEAHRTDTLFTDADCILLERFQAASAEELAEMRREIEEARQMIAARG